MKRREFLKAGAATATVAGAAGAGGLVGSACAGLIGKEMLESGRIPLPDMDEYIRKVDDGLRQIDEWDLTDEVGETDEDLSRENELVKKSLRSLYLAGMFGDLPDAGQVHPGMQARMKRALPEMDQAVFGMCDYLESVSDEDAETFQHVLREKSDPGMEFADWLDGKAWSAKVSTRRRLQTRALLTQTVSRLRNQPPKSMFEEYSSKTRRLAARGGSIEEMQRQMIARMGEEAFWERQQRLAMYAAAWQEERATGGVADPEEELPLPDLPEPSEPVEMDGGPAPDAGSTDDQTGAVAPASDDLPMSGAQAEPKMPVAVITPEMAETYAGLSCYELNGSLQSLITDRQEKRISAEQFNAWNQWLRREIWAQCGTEPSPASVGKPDLSRKARAAGWTAGIGGVILLGGVVVLIAAAGPQDFGLAMVGAGFVTVGLIVLQIGMILAIINGVRRARVKRRFADEAS
jgi:hypothetical protein